MNSEIFPKVSEMSDLALARDIIDDTFGLSSGRRSVVIGLTIAALKRVERALGPDILGQRGRIWTERRVRSIVDLEARRIEHYEIEDLTKMRLAEARLEYQRSTERHARLAALLAAQHTDFHSDEADRLGQRSGRLGGARDCGAAR